MISIRETIIVEGKYDKNKLKQIVDAQVIETAGFGIFKNEEKRNLLRKLGEKYGLIILTDSDGAGFLIRNHLKGIIPGDKIKHAYIPRIKGKERRKDQMSKEGILGVEGMETDVIIEALQKAGATVLGEDSKKVKRGSGITKNDFYEDGLSGGSNSAKLRSELLKKLCFPENMSCNALLEAVNLIMDKEEYKRMVSKIISESDN